MRACSVPQACRISENTRPCDGARRPMKDCMRTLQVTIEAQAAFETARARFAAALAAACGELGVEPSPREASPPPSAANTAAGAASAAQGAAAAADATAAERSTAGSAAAALGDGRPEVVQSSEAPDAHAQTPQQAQAAEEAQTPIRAVSMGSAGSVGGASASSGSPGSVENQPQRANVREGLLLGGGLMRAFGGAMMFKAAPFGALSSANGASGGDGRSAGDSSAEGNGAIAKARSGKPRGRRASGDRALAAIGPATAEKSLALMDDGWSARFGAMH